LFAVFAFWKPSTNSGDATSVSQEKNEQFYCSKIIDFTAHKTQQKSLTVVVK
jgi:hypothetical protein